MHILFDLRSLVALRRADRIYLSALVDGLLPALQACDRVTVLLDAKGTFPFPKVEDTRFVYRLTRHPARSRRGARELAQIVRKIFPAVYWSADPLAELPSLPRRVKVVFSAEALLHLAEVTRGGWLRRRLNRARVRRRVRQATALVCPSHAQEVQTIAALGLPLRRKTRVIHPGVHPLFRQHPEAEIVEARRRWLVPKHYIIIEGRAREGSNLETPLRALGGNEEVPSTTCIIIGSAQPTPELRALIREYHLEGMVRCIDSEAISAADLSALYSGATATFEPAMGADYRPTILQSMACGTPVICAASAQNVELFGNAVLRVHPTDANEWRKAFTALTLSTTLRERLIARGVQCVGNYTWTRTAKASRALAAKLIDGGYTP